MKKTTKSSKKPLVENAPNNEEKIRSLIEEINGLKSHVNPIIAKLSKIYKNRKRYIGSGDVLGLEIKNKEGYILASDSDGIFEDTKVVLELNALESGELVKKRHVIETEEFQTSVFDVLIAHFEIMVKNDKLHFTDTDKSLNIEKLDDILFIKAFDKKAILFNSKNEYVVSNLCKGDFVELLKDNPSFLDIHNSYIVNINKVKKIYRGYKILFPVGSLSLADLVTDYKLMSKKLKDTTEFFENPERDKIEEYEKTTADKPRVRNAKVNQMQNEMYAKIFGDFILYDREHNKISFKIPISEELQSTIQLKI